MARTAMEAALVLVFLAAGCGDDGSSDECAGDHTGRWVGATVDDEIVTRGG
jgi:hypothetical protein